MGIPPVYGQFARPTVASMGPGMSPAMGMPPAAVPQGYSLPGYRQPPTLSAQFQSPEGFPVSVYTLSNGHRLVIENRPTDIISLRTFVNAGSTFEDPVLPSPLYGNTGLPPGIAHLDEHCHFLTLKNHPLKNTWAQEVSDLGAQFNATTEFEMIQHELSFNKHLLPRMLALHAESVLQPTYNPVDIAQEKTNVINEAKQRMRDPSAKVYDGLYALLFDRPVMTQTLGRESDIHRTTVDDLRRFHQMAYVPTQMITVVSGRVNPEQVLQQVDGSFGQNPARIQPVIPPVTKVALRPGEVRHATVSDPQLTYSIVNLGFPAPAKPNLRERAAMEYIGMLLSSGPLSMLETEIIDRQRLASAAGVDFSPMRGSGLMGVRLETVPGQEQQALAATLGVIGTLSTQPVTPQKITEIRDQLLHKYRRQSNDVELATRLLGEEMLQGSLPYHLQYANIINSITPQDIQRTAQKYMRPDTYAVVFGVPQPVQAVAK